MTLLKDAKIAGVGVVETFGEAIQHASINRSIDNAPMVTLTLLDPDLEIINSPLVAGLSDDDDVIIERANPRLDMPPVMSLDGNQWVLVKADKQDSRVVELGFVLFEVYLLTVTNSYRKAFRSKVDRLAFCESMCRESRVKFHAPEAGPPTPTFAGSSEVPGSTPASGAASGFEGGVTIYVNSAPASADAKDALSTSMQYAIGLGVSEDVLIGMVMAGTGESRWYRKATNHVGAGHYGIFQQDPRYYTRPDAYDIVQATHEFLVGGKTWDREKNQPTTTTPQPGSFIKLMQGFTGQASTIGDIITRRQGSDAAGSYYQAYYAESKRTVAAYQSPDRKRSHTVLLAHDKYEFTRGQPGNPESTWTCLSRLASEIGWRRFMVSDTVWFVADEWLFATPAVDTLAEATGAVDSVTWSWDLGKPLNECSITVDDSWIRSPGVVFKVEGQGPATGKWLLAEWERDLLRPTGTLRLVKPGQTIPEPVGDQSGKGWKRKLPSTVPGQYQTGTGLVQPIPEGPWHPFTAQSFHETGGLPGYLAIDFGADAGSPVVAMENGVCRKFSGHQIAEGIFGPQKAFGLTIYLRGDSGSDYFITHLSERTVTEGLRVQAGQQIGVVADFIKASGGVTPNHTHVGVHPGPSGHPDIHDLFRAPRAVPAS